ncbi:MAG: Ryanodine receptor Ryr [Bacteroidales bacterium]|jgi:ryanodine receptor 2|nr:Ryanodine receptor Ryr [Bacteroidales bacterium]
MKTNNYTPNPVDTSSIELPSELLKLAEAMARNVHEVWARTRIEQGWTYGPTRNDQLKQHPCLVPYDELPECEKEYDRRTALETLKTLSAFGWNLVKTEK